MKKLKVIIGHFKLVVWLQWGSNVLDFTFLFPIYILRSHNICILILNTYWQLITNTVVFTILTSIFHTRNMYDLHHTLSVMEYSDLDFYLFLPVSFILSYISMIAIFFFCYCSLSVSGWSPALCVSSGWGYRHEPQYPASPSFLKDSYLGGVFLIGSFSFHHFDYIMLLSPGLPCFCWRIHG